MKEYHNAYKDTACIHLLKGQKWDECPLPRIVRDSSPRHLRAHTFKAWSFEPDSTRLVERLTAIKANQDTIITFGRHRRLRFWYRNA